MKRPCPTQGLLPVAGLEGDALRLEGGGMRAILECRTLAFGIKGEAEQRAVVDGWAALLNSLQHPIQVVIRTRALDREHPDAAGSPHPGRLAELRSSYAGLLKRLASSRQMVSRRHLIVVPWDPPTSVPPLVARLLGRGVTGRPGDRDGLAELDQRVAWITESLRRIDLEPIPLSGAALTSLFLETLCPETATTQPLSSGDDLCEWPELVAPAAVEERSQDLRIGPVLKRTLGLTRYPTRLHPGWLSALESLEGDLDLSLHVHPAPGQAVMSFLDRRVAQLASTTRLAEEQGRRGDPFRRAALDDAQELQDRLARGEERLFDASLYLSVTASTESELDAATRRLEALLGARMLHSRRLIFQMKAGLLATLPLARDPIGLNRSLTTGALAATFPFIGNDLSGEAGLLYGLNPSTRSPVLVDRFGLENHNAVVFATSGAGKSYLVKVELIRACLAGMRAQVIDPEGEYTPIVEALGGVVVNVRPGSIAGLDPFAVPDSEPGSLSGRIATLLALFDLLAGGLTPNQQAAAEDAISFAYAARGFADDGRNEALPPPRLAEIQSRLRLRTKGARGDLRQELEAISLRLERFVSGAGRWLFKAGETAPAAQVVSYCLAGLPEEDRAAAMFLVLDRVWRSLAETSGQTLVVLDEAWWLMQYPDTARFLFRLAKTARKRGAGLTLVTQDVTDVLASPLGEPVVTNAALQVLMKQSPQALPRLAELFRLTQAEQSWLLNARPGEGLLIASGKRVPFKAIASAEEARLIDQQREASAA